MPTPRLLLAALALCACTAAPQTGGDTDAHGCQPSAGRTWSQLKQRCVQVFNAADIRVPDPNNGTLAVYAILSPDRQSAEVFAADLPHPALFTAVKGSYVSADGRARLVRREDGWHFVRKP